jgi:DNA-binding SARP family transcriptional activator
VSGDSRPSQHDLRIQLCGSLVIERGGRRVDARLPGRQGRLLFAFLVLNRHRALLRRELAGALWPDLAPEHADEGLSALLSKVRTVLGPGAIDGRSSVRLVAADPWVDLEVAREAVHRAESSVAQRDWSRAWGPSQVALFAAARGLLVEDGDDSLAWLVDERRRVTQLRLRALETYGLACLGIGGTEVASAVRAGTELVEAAPFRESGHRLLMQALVASGNPAEAHLAYARLRGLLRDELGVSPSPQTENLHRAINR